MKKTARKPVSKDPPPVKDPQTPPRQVDQFVSESDHDEDRGLVSLRRQRIRTSAEPSPHEWMRPYWLGAGLFLVLLAFWILDVLKDPIFGALVGGNLERHQPPAKLFSVCLTLALVVFLEYVSSERKKRQDAMKSEAEVLDAGGQWTKMSIGQRGSSGEWDPEDEGVSSNIFLSVGLPYCLAFGVMAYMLQFNPAVALTNPSTMEGQTTRTTFWKVLGYFLYAGIESFGSIAVATFWSFTNSTLSLEDAERYYGLIIAIAQLGAIAGSTMVTAYIWSNVTLMVLSTLVILLHVLVMSAYNRRFRPTADHAERGDDDVSTMRSVKDDHEPTLWSGVYLILKHNYVLLILGASCLYEVSLTCLNYQMTLLGWTRFNETEHEGMNFTQFMGHYGQMVNVSSLIMSSLIFPWLLKRFGLRLTLRLFPTLLLVANFVAFGALPGNLAVLFLSMSLLKAMTYSIHDPSKEILYLPTSNAIKFKAKFWIDVVGARIAKAIGSSINTLSGSVDRSIRVASAPSLLTAVGLWYVCYRVGQQFDRLVSTGHIVGVDADDDEQDDLQRRMSADEYNKLVEEEALEAAEDEAIFEDPTSASLDLSPLRRH